MSPSEQQIKDSIKKWFLLRYEDPANSTPYDSSEGGYLYAFGGPYNPHDVLQEQFSGQVPYPIIDQAASELECELLEWAKIPTLEDIDPDLIGMEFFWRFKRSIADVKMELDSLAERKEEPFLYALLFAHLITCLEVYLCDAFLTAVKQPKFLQKYIETDEALGKEKIVISDIFKKMQTLNADAVKKLQSFVFHNLAPVQHMYRNTLDIEFPPGLKVLYEAVAKRHDIVHRNCRTIDGKSFTVTRQEVISLLESLENFVSQLNMLVEDRIR